MVWARMGMGGIGCVGKMGWMKKVHGEMAGTEDISGQCRNLVQSKLLEIYEGDATRHVLQPDQAHSFGAMFHLVLLLVNGVPQRFQTTQADSKTEGCSPKTNNKSPTVKENFHTTCQNWKSQVSICMEPSPLYSSLLVREGTLQITKRETWTSIQPQNL